VRSKGLHPKALLLAGALAYLLAWGLTCGVGAPAVRAFVVTKMQVPEGVAEVSSLAELDEGRGTYYCNVIAPMPLVVRMEFGSTCGPLCGHGRTEYFLWLPGTMHRILVTAAWVS
jgi:hypothetical protein